MEPKRFCFLLGRYFEQVRGGAEYQAYLLAQQLLRRGYEVHYVYVDDGSDFIPSIPVTLHPLRWGTLRKRFPRYGLMGDAGQITRLLHRIAPDVIYQRAACAYTGIAGRYARRTGACFVWHIANETDVIPVPLNWRNLVHGRALEKAFIRRGMQQADIIIAQAEYQVALLRANYGLDAQAVVPNFHPAAEEECAKRDDGVDIVWIANLKPQKQPERFIELARALRDRTDARFWMAGRRDKGGVAGVLGAAVDLDNFRYVGELPLHEVNRLLARAHLFVNTSAYEGFPNTFIQAWLRETPVLSLRVDPDGVLAREGIGVCPGSMERLIEDCDALIEDPERRARMGKRARTYAERVHAVEPNVQRVLDLVAAWEARAGKRAGHRRS